MYENEGAPLIWILEMYENEGAPLIWISNLSNICIQYIHVEVLYAV